MTAVAVATALETSALMQSSGFVDAVTIGAPAFIGDLLVGDAVAVTSFGGQGVVNYPGDGGMAVIDQTLSQQTAAAAAVRALTFTSATVDIGAGLQTAYGVFGSAPAGSTPGVLLISSGQQSSGGTDPLKLASYQPTSVCAPGPTANAALLAQIATLSRGQYYYAPTPSYMQTVLNQVRAQQPGWTMALNKANTVAPLSFWLQPVTLPANLAQAQFSVVWENAALTFTTSPNPTPNQVSVTLVQPPGITVTPAPSAVGGGYCAFDLTTPVGGQWYVQVMYGGSAALPMTIGVFQRPAANAMLELLIEPTETPVAGRPLTLRLALAGAEGPVQVVAAVVEIVSPRHAGDVAAHEWRAYPLCFDDGLLATIATPAAMAPGSVSVKAHVRGVGPAGPFETTRLISVHVSG
jgi:hypothetical protein